MRNNDNNSIRNSDESRSSKPLKYAQYKTFKEPLKLEHGSELKNIRVCYETYGKLNDKKNNVILICHALSGDSHVAAHNSDDESGWWDLVVGPNKIIDTNKYYVICPNVLGGCRGTTGPDSINPDTEEPYGRDFPVITIGDMVNVQKLLMESFGINKIFAVIGGSMGGQMVLCWAINYPKAMNKCIAVATSPRLTSQALAFDIVGRNAILHDPNYKSGKYYKENIKPHAGLAIARMIGHITYLSREAMHDKFESTRNIPKNVATSFEKRFSVGSYLGYQGDKFVERFDANSYIVLTMAMDMFDSGKTIKELTDKFKNTDAKWLVLSFSSDWLFPPDQSAAIVNSLIANNKEVSYCNITSKCGHDAFLLRNDIHLYGELIKAFLEQSGNNYIVQAKNNNKNNSDNEVNIFSGNRLDYERIISLIPKGKSVLDLGCGHGELLSRLKKTGYKRVLGVELDEQAILSCVQKGLDVIYADLNGKLDQFSNGQFEYVVLSRTLQAVYDVEGVLNELVRIGKKGIVSFPNFAYYKLRKMLTEQGRAPESLGILNNKWYNTPNIRFFSIADFESLCEEKGYIIHNRVAIDTEAGKEINSNINNNADLAIFTISK